MASPGQCIDLCADDTLETVAEFLEALVCLSAATEPAAWEARLLAAIAARRAQVGKPLPPGRRSEVERSLALLRVALGDAAFDTAWTEGTTLTLEEATVFAGEDGSLRTSSLSSDEQPGRLAELDTPTGPANQP